MESSRQLYNRHVAPHANAAWEGTTIATKHIIVGTKTGVDAAVEASKKANEMAKPHFEMLRSLYNAHLKEFVDDNKHYIEPALQVGNTVFSRGKQGVTLAISKTRVFAIKQVETSCANITVVVAEGDSSDLPEIVRDFVHQTCEEPKQTVDHFFLATA